MKTLPFSLILAAALLAVASCNKQYDTTVSDSQATGSSNGGGGFNWTGTAPMSAKVNGASFQANEVYFSNAGGYYNIMGQENNAIILGVSVPAGAAEGKVYSAPTPAGVSGAFPPSLALISSTGKVKVITNSSTILEGYFWADLRDPNGLSDTTVHITEGYFKVDKQ